MPARRRFDIGGEESPSVIEAEAVLAMDLSGTPVLQEMLMQDAESYERLRPPGFPSIEHIPEGTGVAFRTGYVRHHYGGAVHFAFWQFLESKQCVPLS